MAIDQAYVSNIDPGFAAVPGARATALIGIAAAQVSLTVWGTLSDYAAALLTLHTWTLSKGGGSGTITEKSLGDMKLSFSVNRTSDTSSALEMTSWGREYKRLGMTRIAGPLVTWDV